MSKWTDSFEAHPFQATWTSLKESLAQSEIDDETVVTSVTELARLKKVVEYLDGLIQTIDPELVPQNTWDTFNQQAVPCLQQVNAYISNKNIANIVKANAHADNLLTYIRPYMVLPKDAAASIKRASTIYANDVEKYVESFQEKASVLLIQIDKHKSVTDGLLSEITTTKESIDEFESTLFGENGDGGVQTEITEMYQDLLKKHENVIELYNELLVGGTEELSTKKEISQVKENILEQQEDIEKLLASVNTEVEELEHFHSEMFGELDSDDTRRGGLSNELEKLKVKLVEFEQAQTKRYSALNDEIETLLPGATSAGLATAYKDLKDEFDVPITNMTRLFYGSVGLLVIASLLLAIESIGGTHLITFVKFNEWDVVLKGLVYKLPFYAPIIWLAFFATKRRSEYQRLRQEYAHKEAIAKSYNSYKKQVQELNEDDHGMQKELILKALEAIAYNASATLDGKHGDKMPAQDMFNSVIEAVAKLKG